MKRAPDMNGSEAVVTKRAPERNLFNMMGQALMEGSSRSDDEYSQNSTMSDEESYYEDDSDEDSDNDYGCDDYECEHCRNKRRDFELAMSVMMAKLEKLGIVIDDEHMPAFLTTAMHEFSNGNIGRMLPEISDQKSFNEAIAMSEKMMQDKENRTAGYRDGDGKSSKSNRDKDSMGSQRLITGTKGKKTVSSETNKYACMSAADREEADRKANAAALALLMEEEDKENKQKTKKSKKKKKKGGAVDEADGGKVATEDMPEVVKLANGYHEGSDETNDTTSDKVADTNDNHETSDHKKSAAVTTAAATTATTKEGRPYTDATDVNDDTINGGISEQNRDKNDEDDEVEDNDRDNNNNNNINNDDDDDDDGDDDGDDDDDDSDYDDAFLGGSHANKSSSPTASDNTSKETEAKITTDIVEEEFITVDHKGKNKKKKEDALKREGKMHNTVITASSRIGMTDPRLVVKKERDDGLPPAFDEYMASTREHGHYKAGSNDMIERKDDTHKGAFTATAMDEPPQPRRNDWASAIDAKKPKLLSADEYLRQSLHNDDYTVLSTYLRTCSDTVNLLPKTKSSFENQKRDLLNFVQRLYQQMKRHDNLIAEFRRQEALQLNNNDGSGLDLNDPNLYEETQEFLTSLKTWRDNIRTGRKWFTMVEMRKHRLGISKSRSTDARKRDAGDRSSSMGSIERDRNGKTFDTAVNQLKSLLDPNEKERSAYGYRENARSADVPEEEKDADRIFVGGLSYKTDTSKLRKYFSQYGMVKDAVVMTESKTKRSRGFGFVTFVNPSSVDEVLHGSMEPRLDGRKVLVQRAVSKGSYESRNNWIEEEREGQRNGVDGNSVSLEVFDDSPLDIYVGEEDVGGHKESTLDLSLDSLLVGNNSFDLVTHANPSNLTLDGLSLGGGLGGGVSLGEHKSNEATFGILDTTDLFSGNALDTFTLSNDQSALNEDNIDKARTLNNTPPPITNTASEYQFKHSKSPKSPSKEDFLRQLSERRAESSYTDIPEFGSGLDSIYNIFGNDQYSNMLGGGGNNSAASNLNFGDDDGNTPMSPLSNLPDHKTNDSLLSQMKSNTSSLEGGEGNNDAFLLPQLQDLDVEAVNGQTLYWLEPHGFSFSFHRIVEMIEGSSAKKEYRLSFVAGMGPIVSGEGDIAINTMASIVDCKMGCVYDDHADNVFTLSNDTNTNKADTPGYVYIIGSERSVRKAVKALNNHLKQHVLGYKDEEGGSSSDSDSFHKNNRNVPNILPHGGPLGMSLVGVGSPGAPPGLRNTNSSSDGLKSDNVPSYLPQQHSNVSNNSSNTTLDLIDYPETDLNIDAKAWSPPQTFNTLMGSNPNSPDNSMEEVGEMSASTRRRPKGPTTPSGVVDKGGRGKKERYNKKGANRKTVMMRVSVPYEAIGLFLGRGETNKTRLEQTSNISIYHKNEVGKRKGKSKDFVFHGPVENVMDAISKTRKVLKKYEITVT